MGRNELPPVCHHPLAIQLNEEARRHGHTNLPYPLAGLSDAEIAEKLGIDIRPFYARAFDAVAGLFKQKAAAPQQQPQGPAP